MDPVRHFELSANDRTKLGEFYGKVFGWHTEEFPEMQYVTVDTHSGTGINGGIGPSPEGDKPATSVYIEVPDLQASLDLAESLGAKTIMPVTEVPGVVTLAMFLDPAGNPIGLVKNETDMPQSTGDNPPVNWFEILGPDPKALRDFYAKLFSWELKASESADEGFEYYEVHGDDRIGGGVGSSRDGAPHVTSYAQVDDIQAYLDKVEANGGKTAMPPMSAGEVSFAQFSDPEGIVFGLWSHA